MARHLDLILIGIGRQIRAGLSRGVYDTLRSFSQKIQFTFYLFCSGKTLGGSTSINGAAYTRGLNAQYDAWSSLLEPSEAGVGWNWQNLWSYMKKV
jgi:choline dehydrogenase-like flavoprotein